ncbi:MAG: hypothetical protein PHG82_03790 [Candidatus Gracilibacteria bacterium]|nr:hypothetical protein [Candidatus Gracilibacteria bacterium]
MEILSNLKKGIIQGIGIILVLILSGATYAAWTALSTETDGGTLTSTKWNAVINRLNSIDQKSLATAWVNFDGTVCTLGTGNDCNIRSSFNISRVRKITTGQYEVFFANPVDNINYSLASITSYNTDATAYISSEDKRLGARSVNSFFIGAWTSAYADSRDIQIQVFGGKN